MSKKYYILFAAFAGLMSCAAHRPDQSISSSECPEYWIKLGTGCYLFAIPEILNIDGSCKIDGKRIQ